MLKKCESLLHCKSYSHFFSKKFRHICVSQDVNFNVSLTNDVISFEQLGPGEYSFVKYVMTFHFWNGEELWYQVDCPSVSPSVPRSACHMSLLPSSISLYFLFRLITWVNISWFSPNLVCALILWRSGLALLIGKFRQFLTEFSAPTCSYFQFRSITWVNINGFSSNLVCALILWRSGLGLPMGKFRQILTLICPRHDHIFVPGQ